MNVLDYIASETERQSGTVREGLGMYAAWRYLRGYAEHEGDYLSESALLHMHLLIKGVKGYRPVPAVFNQGMPALKPELIPNAMKNLISGINDRNVWHDAVRDFLVDMFTREFLSIHPFADGNGRVGSLLWNWMRGSLDDPEPMPYFFGENNA